ncbi:MAG: molybdate ABC transporter substrate-binding protein [Chloroflexi bacterium]|nr:MAG: molybdate ABC transporter substrate-binding protein [Chloroflexota bacterium]
MKRSLHLFLLLVALCSTVAACGNSSSSSAASTPSSIKINIFAAASLTESFTQIAAAYHQLHPDVTITNNFNGSQLLEQQIANGAPADVFASADMANMMKASNAGLVGDAKVFVKNRLVVIIPVGNPGQIMSLKDLARKGVKIDLEADTVPAGHYSRQALMNMSQSPDFGANYGNSVLANVVSQEENVKAVVQKVQLGEVDAGFVYRTDVTAAVASKVTVLDIPDPFNVIAQYPIAVVKSSANAAAAQSFVDYVLSMAGEGILAKYHFIAVNP